MALHPAPGFPPLASSCLCARDFRCMQGDMLAAAARTANSDQPLPMSPLSLVPAHTSSPHSQRRRASLVISPVRATPSVPHPLAHARAHRRLPALAVQPCSAAAAAAAAAGLVAAAAAARRHFQSLPLSRMRVGVRGCRATTQMLRSSASAAQLGPARLDSSSPLSRALLLLLPLPPFSSLSTPLPVSYCPHHHPSAHHPPHRCHCASPPSHVIPSHRHHGLGQPQPGSPTTRCCHCYVAHRPCECAEAQEKPEPFLCECDAHRPSPARCESTQDF